MRFTGKDKEPAKIRCTNSAGFDEYQFDVVYAPWRESNDSHYKYSYAAGVKPWEGASPLGAWDICDKLEEGGITTWQLPEIGTSSVGLDRVDGLPLDGFTSWNELKNICDHDNQKCINPYFSNAQTIWLQMENAGIADTVNIQAKMFFGSPTNTTNAYRCVSSF